MLYMVIEDFRGDPVPVYRRFREQGRLAPGGLRYINSWVTRDLLRCYQVMRTAHWYDVTWSADTVKVNDEIEVRGRLHIFSDWPKHLFELRTVYLNLGANGPVFVKVATYLNEVPMMQSTHLEYGREYEFRIVAKARTPGRHHVHPMLNVESAGPLLGPGKWIEVTGNAADFVMPLQTLDGIAIPNLETWQVGHVLRVHAYWIVLALAWLACLRPFRASAR